jgi:enterochelin esterase-like enzyme
MCSGMKFKTREHRETELACNDRFTQFLADEILPWYRLQTGLSPYAETTTLVGSSLGGLATCYSALKRPDLFGNVISQSCAVTWIKNRLMPEFEDSPKQKLRIVFDMGSLEYCHTAGQYSTEMLAPFRHLLDSMNYETLYREYNGGHDYPCWAASLSDGLAAFSTFS